MSNQFEDIINDLEDEQRALERVLEKMSPEDWDRPSHAPGWLARDQVTHLAFFDEAATRAIVDPAAFQDEVRRVLAEGGRQEDEYLAKGRDLAPEVLFDWWRSASSGLIRAARGADPKARLPWYGPPMSGVSFVTARLMETWSHGLDVVDAVEGDRPDTDRLRHVAFLGVRTRPFSYQNRGLEPNLAPVHVTLTAPSGAVWELGEESQTDRISGAATDFCRVVTQRRHLADTNLKVEGPNAVEWMDIAQAFAGPPGPGRKPGQFAHEKATP
jgi:uncharacterized protein (TIGR03084 family)